MKRIFSIVLVLLLAVSITACSQQGTAEISSQQVIDGSSENSSPSVSYPSVSSNSVSSELTDASSSFSPTSHYSDQTSSQQDETLQIELFADDIMEFGLTVGRLSGDLSAPSQQTVSTTDTALINEIVEKINSLVYIRDLKMESDHRYMNGIGWEFWSKNRNGQKTIFQCSSRHYIQNGAWYRVKDSFDLLEYLKDKLNASWW